MTVDPIAAAVQTLLTSTLVTPVIFLISKLTPTGQRKATLQDAMVTLGDGPDSVSYHGGTVIVIHAKEDDYKTDPAGNSGPRIACGVIER
jgi:hypothetical protein